MKIVLKYGGTSVASIEQLIQIAKYIKKIKKKYSSIIIVASAMGKTTNNYLNLISQITNKPNLRETDALLSIGENQTVSLLAIALNSIGVKAISLNGSQAKIGTTNSHTKSYITQIDTRRIIKELKNGNVVLISGFQGVNKFNDISTLGRGGSDTTAVAIASVLKCPCKIFTDVDCIYTLDPNKYINAKKINVVTYDEMMELSVNGAKVLDTRCVEIAKKYNVQLYLSKSGKYTKGTKILKFKNIEEMPITGITQKNNVCIITLKTHIKNLNKISSIFDALNFALLNIEMLSQTTFKNTILLSFVILQSSTEDVINKIYSIFNNTEFEIIKDCNISKITIVGLGFCTHPEMCSKIFNTLNNYKIPYKQISTSEIAVSFTTDNKFSDLAIEKISKEFNLQEKI